MTTLEKILELIKIRGLTEIEFTRLVGLSKATVSEWKKGRIKSYNKHLPKIAEVLCVDVEELMDDPIDEGLFNPAALAINIENLAKSNNIVIEDLLKELNLDSNILKKMKNGMEPTIEVLKAFSEKFRVPFDVLYGVTDLSDYPSEIPEKFNKLFNYYERLNEEDQDYILGEMVRLYKKSQE